MQIHAQHERTLDATESSAGTERGKDADHLPADGFLPALAEAVDGGLMGKRLQHAMFGEAGGRHRLERCRIERTKYRPGRRCTIGYRLAIRDRDDDALHEHFLTAHLFEPGASTARFEKYRSGAWVPPRFGPPLLHLERMDMILWSFPNDRHLPALPLLTDRRRLRNEIMPGLVERHFGPDWSIVSLASALASYVHERRCSVRVEMKLRSSAGGVWAWRIFGKTAGDDSDSSLSEAASRYWQSRDGIDVGVHMPAPLGAWPNRRIVWQEAVAGTPLAEGRRGKLDEDDFRRAGAAVAGLHGCALDGARDAGLDGALDRLRARAETIATWPAYRSRVTPIVDQLLAAASDLDRETRVAAHGDLHGRNILVEGQEIALIDLDEAISGPPARDLGHFVAYTLAEQGRVGHGEDSIARSLASFVDGYRRAADWPIRTSEIAWHAAAALVTEKIFREVTLMQPGGKNHLADLIELAERLSRGDGSPAGLDCHAER